MKSLQEENELLKERLENRPVLTLLVTRMLKLYLEHHPTGSQGCVRSSQMKYSADRHVRQ